MVAVHEAADVQIMQDGKITGGKNDVSFGLCRLTVFPAAAGCYRWCACWFHIFHCSRERTSTKPQRWISCLTLFLADAYRSPECQGEHGGTVMADAESLRDELQRLKRGSTE